MSERPIRVVRARDLVKGATVVTKCAHPAPHCSVPADKHQSGTERLDHCLTVLDVEKHDGLVSAICVSESGEQYGLAEVEWQMIRVFADSMPQTTAAQEG